MEEIDDDYIKEPMSEARKAFFKDVLLEASSALNGGYINHDEHLGANPIKASWN